MGQISLPRGDGLAMWAIVDRVNLDGCTVYFTVKQRASDLDSLILFQYSTGSGIVHSGNRADWSLLPAHTNALAEHTQYVWDVRYKGPDNIPYTVETGTLRVTPTVLDVV